MVRAHHSLYGEGGTPGQRRIGFENELTAHALADDAEHKVTVQASAGATLKVTLVWTDYPAAPNSGSPLVVNDLDLSVQGPDGLFLGNRFGGDEWSDPGGSADVYNVVENVYLQGVLGGTYVVTVKGRNVMMDRELERPGIEQDFSLVVSSSAPLVTDCSNGTDDDGDGRTDALDPGCVSDADLSEVADSASLPCDDGFDNDGDSLVDTADPTCAKPESPRERTQCQDGIDNDGQSGTDFDGGESIHGVGNGDPQGADPQCLGKPWRDLETPRRSCGLGFELALLAPLAWLLGRRAAPSGDVGPRVAKRLRIPIRPSAAVRSGGQ
jgi:hypothetical protein